MTVAWRRECLIFRCAARHHYHITVTAIAVPFDTLQNVGHNSSITLTGSVEGFRRRVDIGVSAHSHRP